MSVINRGASNEEQSTAGTGAGPHWREPLAFLEIQETLRCPVDMRPLRWIESEGVLLSSDGQRRYPVVDDIPCLFAPNEWPEGKSDVTEMAKSFYEDTPFPNYDDLDGRESLLTKLRRGVFERLLDEQLGRPMMVLEAGCGTGQLSNFLGMGWGRTVIGADLCLNSLRLAKSFRDRCSIANVQFVQMNLFRPPFEDGTFDLVICNGVLHHTSDPEGGFHSIARKLKPGGHVIVGLYNWLGRLPTLWRRRLSARYRAQHRHPHESKHSMAEVGKWFDLSGIDLTFTIPPVGGEDFTEDTQLFRPRPPHGNLGYAVSELEMLLTGGRDGGLYTMIGRKH